MVHIIKNFDFGMGYTKLFSVVICLSMFGCSTKYQSYTFLSVDKVKKMKLKIILH